MAPASIAAPVYITHRVRTGILLTELSLLALLGGHSLSMPKTAPRRQRIRIAIVYPLPPWTDRCLPECGLLLSHRLLGHHKVCPAILLPAGFVMVVAEGRSLP